MWFKQKSCRGRRVALAAWAFAAGAFLPAAPAMSQYQDAYPAYSYFPEGQPRYYGYAPPAVFEPSAPSPEEPQFRDYRSSSGTHYYAGRYSGGHPSRAIARGVRDASARQTIPVQSELDSMTSSDVRKAQERLAQIGFDPGPADGMLGRKTEDALRAFQRQYDAAETDALGPLTIKRLEEAAEKAQGSVQPANPYVLDSTLRGIMDDSRMDAPAIQTQAVPQMSAISDAGRLPSANPFYRRVLPNQSPASAGSGALTGSGAIRITDSTPGDGTRRSSAP